MVYRKEKRRNGRVIFLFDGFQLKKMERNRWNLANNCGVGNDLMIVDASDDGIGVGGCVSVESRRRQMNGTYAALLLLLLFLFFLQRRKRKKKLSPSSKIIRTK